MTTTSCARCGDFVDTSTGLYSEGGEIVCTACDAREAVDGGEQRAARSIFAASFSSVGLGLVAILAFNPCLLVTVFGVLSAIGTFVVLHRHPEHRARLGPRLPVAIGAASVGLLLSLFAPLLRLGVGWLTGGWMGFL